MNLGNLSNSGKFSKQDARILVELARLSYRDPSDVRTFVDNAPNWDLAKKFNDKATGTQAYLFETADAAVVAFRGTETDQRKDLLTDAKIGLVKGHLHTGKVHRGFHRALDSIWAKVEPALNSASSQNKHCYFTGHSLGGALAVLAAARFDKTSGVYTFGQPRVGDEVFCTAYDSANGPGKRTYRFVNQNDIIPRVPPRLAGFEHVGTQVYFDEAGNHVTKKSIIQRLSNMLDGAARSARARFMELDQLLLIRGAIRSHGIDNYVLNVSNM